MKLVTLQINRYRRFEAAKINLDAPVVALVGPNEAGKSSLLQALVNIGQSLHFGNHDFTRGVEIEGPVFVATYLLEQRDIDVLQDQVPEASEVRWYRVSKFHDGELGHELLPDVEWTCKNLSQTRSSLMEIVDIFWDVTGTHFPPDHETISKILSWMPQDNRTHFYSDNEIQQLTELLNLFSQWPEEELHPKVIQARDNVAAMRDEISGELPNETAAEILDDLLPTVLDFTENDRSIHTTYDLQAPQTWTDGLRNLARLADLDLGELTAAVVNSRSDLRQEYLRQANRHLEQIFRETWLQSELTVELDVQGTQLQIHVSSDGGVLHRLENRSDGMRIHLALVAFLANREELSVPPIVVLDEAESHLHWDAQAELVKMLHNQKFVSQVIYSTHSPGCLPNDLGCGVRSVVPTEDDRSIVRDWIWERRAGYRPLLTDMGASTAALTPFRFSVATEGITDFILLPALLRAASGDDSLPYQVVPGISQLSREGLRSIDSECESTLYLLDGDQGGKDLRRQLKGVKIEEDRIFLLPDGVVLEDLIDSEVLHAAIKEELHRSGHQIDSPIELPDSGRTVYIENLFEQESIESPNKRNIASRVLELTARSPDEVPKSLVEDGCKTFLCELHQSFLAAFGLA